MDVALDVEVARAVRRTILTNLLWRSAPISSVAAAVLFPQPILPAANGSPRHSIRGHRRTHLQ
ncbi:hypothetical protein CN233_10365 [Sinorhizobium meliloti]|nr:hypothetical protein CN233_10365 [Sinorhizobium meliloti]RVL01599.1 hypothetical protein CN152_11660 [Sinorhizobium meliloti]RVN45667.1 hypothetical protein CN113_17750 [Sinorhizobium meliloti]